MLKHYNKADADIIVTVIRQHGVRHPAWETKYTPPTDAIIYWGIKDGIMSIFQYKEAESEFDPSLYDRTGAFYKTVEPNWHTDANHNEVTEIVLGNEITPYVVNSFFKDFYNVQTFTNLTNLNIQNTKTLYGMFENCASVVELDLRSFDTSNIWSTTNMFADCVNLEHIYADINKWTKEPFTDSVYMFKDTYFLHNYNGIQNESFAMIDDGENNGYLEEIPYPVIMTYGINKEQGIWEVSDSELDPELFDILGELNILYTEREATLQNDVEEKNLNLDEQEGEEP